MQPPAAAAQFAFALPPQQQLGPPVAAPQRIQAQVAPQLLQRLRQRSGSAAAGAAAAGTLAAGTSDDPICLDDDDASQQAEHGGRQAAGAAAADVDMADADAGEAVGCRAFRMWGCGTDDRAVLRACRPTLLCPALPSLLQASGRMRRSPRARSWTRGSRALSRRTSQRLMHAAGRTAAGRMAAAANRIGGRKRRRRQQQMAATRATGALRLRQMQQQTQGTVATAAGTMLRMQTWQRGSRSRCQQQGRQREQRPSHLQGAQNGAAVAATWKRRRRPLSSSSSSRTQRRAPSLQPGTPAARRCREAVQWLQQPPVTVSASAPAAPQSTSSRCHLCARSSSRRSSSRRSQ